MRGGYPLALPGLFGGSLGMRVFALLALLMCGTTAQAQSQWRDIHGNPLAPSLDHAAHDNFGVHLISTTDPQRLMHDWAEPALIAGLSTQDEAARNQGIVTFIVFSGCRAGPDGNCNITARIELRDPLGKPYSQPLDAPVWNLPSPPPGILQLSKAGAGIRIASGEPLGKYRVIAHITDHVANITLTTEKTLAITEAPN